MNKQVEQIKAEIERLKSIADYQLDNCKVDKSAWSQQAEVCKKILSFINSMGEDRPEPISPADVGFEALGKVWDEEARKDSDELTHSVTKMSDQEEPANDYVLGGTKSNKSWVIHPESIPHDKKPVNEDLEEEWERYITSEEYLKDIPGGLPVARHFAKWQKEIDKLIFYNDLSEFEDIKKLVVNEIASINTIETIDTDFDGWYNRLIVFAKRCAQWQKQQMMKNTVDAVAEKPLAIADGCEDAVRFEVVGDEFAQGFKSGDKVKIIIIKEDKI